MAALVALVVLHWSGWVWAQPTKVAIGYSGISADQLVIWDAGIFAKNNIDAETVYFSGGTLSITAMVSGDTPVVQASGPGIVSQTGSTPERLAAMESRRVSGSTLVPPAMFTAQKKGFHLLADVASLGLAYRHQGGVTTKRYLREHPDVVRNFVKSYIEAVHRLKRIAALD
jgi:ABC-type nitrate/sulfonate/bicarbonate transport system substrate-binding protein